MGYRIKELRGKKNLTQEQLAEISGVSRGTIAALESGEKQNTTTFTLVKLANGLGVTVDFLFSGDNV